jgi:hypothetical protein
MNQHQTINELVLTLTTNIFLPCLPIFIERLVVYLVPGLTAEFPNRDIIIISFLIPIVWVVRIQNKVLLIFASIFILFASVPFVISITNPSPKVYWSGFILTIAAILFFSSSEISAFIKFKQDQKVSDIEEIDI